MAVSTIAKPYKAYSTGTATAGSDISTKGYSIIRSSLWKVGQLVVLNVVFQWSSGADSAVNLLTTPTGFRPIQAIEGRAYTTRTINWTLSTAGVLNISSTGTATSTGNERLYIVFATD